MGYQLDKQHAEVGFSVKHLMIATVKGKFKTFDATVDFDPANVASSKVEATVDVASIETHEAQRDGHLKSPDFFDVASFPKLSFESNRIEALGGDRYRVYGNLTIRDVTREVVLESEFSGRAKDPWGNDRVAFTAKASIERSDFGLKWNQALETGGVVVGERVEIELDVQAVKAAATKAA